MGEVVKVLVAVRQVQGRRGVVLTNMVAEDWRKEEVGLLWLARLCSRGMVRNTDSCGVAKEGKAGVSPLDEF